MIKFFKNTLLLISMMITTSVYAIDQNSIFNGITNEAGCGLVYSTSNDSKSPVTVENNNFTICQNDLAFNTFYMVFGNLLESEVAKSVVEIFVDVKENTRSLNKISGLGVPIQAIFQALSSLILFFGGIMLLYQTGKFIYVTQSSGQFMGKDNGKTLNIVMQGLTAAFLIVPVGDILMIQLIILIMAIIGIMIANFFLSSFLHSSYIKSTEVETNFDSILESGSNFASKLTEINLCETRTATSLLNAKTTTTSQYINESPNTNLFFSNNDMIEFNEVVNECVIKYYAMPFESKNTEDVFSVVQIFRPEYYDCDEQDPISQIQNYPEDFGYEHVCGQITYNWPDLNGMKDLTPTGTFTNTPDYKAIKLVQSYISDRTFEREFKTGIHFPKFKNEIGSQIKNILQSNDLDVEKQKKLNAIYQKEGDALFEKIKSSKILNKDQFENVKNTKLKNDLIAATNIIGVNTMLGAYFESGARAGNLGSPTIGSDDDYHYLTDRNLFGFDVLRKTSALDASTELQRAHCSFEWANFSGTRQFFNEYKEKLNNNDDAKDFLSSNYKNFECFLFDKVERKFKYVLEEPQAFADINSDNSINNDTNDVKKFFRNEAYSSHMLNAKIELEIMNGYYFSVKYAFMKNLAQSLKEANDSSTLIRARQMGWAYLGSILLDISNGQSNSRKAVDILNETASAGSSASYNGKNVSFENKDAFLKSDTNANNGSNSLKSMQVAIALMNTGNLTMGKDSLVISDEAMNLNAFEIFTSWFRNFIFSPLVYIQRGSGMDTNDSLYVSLEKCSKTSECVPSESHPLNTLMMFGNDLISQTITIILTGEVAHLIAKSTSGVSGEDKNGTGEKISFIKVFLKKIPWITVISYIAVAVDVTISILSPVLYLLLFVGVFCSYMLPTLPFVIFALVFLTWLINIFAVIFSAPIWVLTLANIQEDGRTQITFNQIWRKTGSVLLKPALVTVAMIFAWTLSSVSLFFINSTIYPIFATIEDSGFIITDMITVAVTYVLYILTIVMVIKHSFSIISKFGDDLLQAIGVEPTGDASLIGGMGLERLLATTQISQMLQNGLMKSQNFVKDGGAKPSQMAYKLRNKMNERIKNREEERQNLMDKKEQTMNELNPKDN